MAKSILVRKKDVGERHCQRWLIRADATYVSARTLYHNGQAFWDDACFLMQQSIEKYLKTYIVLGEMYEAAVFQRSLKADFNKTFGKISGMKPKEYEQSVVFIKKHDLLVLLQECIEAEDVIEVRLEVSRRHGQFDKISGRFDSLAGETSIVSFFKFLNQFQERRYGEPVSTKLECPTDFLCLYDKTVCYIRNKIWIERHTLNVPLARAHKKPYDASFERMFLEFSKNNSSLNAFNFKDLRYTATPKTAEIIFS